MMIGFGELNEEFGKLPPYLISIEEVSEKGYATNSLILKIETDTGIIIRIEFDSYIMHMTHNESFTAWDNYEVRKGNYLLKMIDVLPKQAYNWDIKQKLGEKVYERI